MSIERTGPAHPAAVKPGDKVWVTSDGVLDHQRVLATSALISDRHNGVSFNVVAGNDNYSQGWGRDGVFYDQASAEAEGRRLLALQIENELHRHTRAIARLTQLALG